MKEYADGLRALALDCVAHAGSGHIGMPLGMADVITVLFFDFLKFRAKDPTWINRDRLIFSNGHGSALMYAALHLAGYEALSLEELKRFRQAGSRTPGHPENDIHAGVEMATGPLGQGLAGAVGMALAAKMMAERCSHDASRVWVVCGDGCLQEGISHEVGVLAGHWRLDNLIVLWDDNEITIDGKTSLSGSWQEAERFASYGWNVLSVDGHDNDAIGCVLREAVIPRGKPTFIQCRTIIGKGTRIQGTEKAHGGPLSPHDFADARQNLGAPEPMFAVSDAVRSAWRDISTRSTQNQATHDSVSSQKCPDGPWPFALSQDRVHEVRKVFEEYENEWHHHPEKERATRISSGEVLSAITKRLPFLIGGSADLSLSTNALTPSHTPISSENYGGNYIHYGVREHGMAAIMNGIALYGGFVPYGSTFLAFSDYMRPAMRLAALMGLGVIYVLTHDSVAVGEDGPSHQPIEHLDALRMIPNFVVLRPCNQKETADCWRIALSQTNRPSALILSRQNIPPIAAASPSLAHRGAYVICDDPTSATELPAHTLTVWASGSEVALGDALIRHLRDHCDSGIKRFRLVSAVSHELFLEESLEWRESVIGPKKGKHMGLEAGRGLSWLRLIEGAAPSATLTLGIHRFGLSAPACDVLRELNFDLHALTRKTMDWLRGTQGD